MVENADPAHDNLRIRSLIAALEAMPESLREVANRLHRHLANHIVTPDDLEAWLAQWETLKSQLHEVIEVNRFEQWIVTTTAELREARIRALQEAEPEIPLEQARFLIQQAADLPVGFPQSPEDRNKNFLVSSLPETIRALKKSANPLDQANLDLFRRVQAALTLEDDQETIPLLAFPLASSSFLFDVFSKTSRVAPGEIPVSPESHERKVKTILEALVLRAPSRRERSMPAFGNSATLFALPTTKISPPRNFADVKQTTLIIDIRLLSLHQLADSAKFIGALSASINLPEEAFRKGTRPRADFTYSPQRAHFTEDEWNEYAGQGLDKHFFLKNCVLKWKNVGFGDSKGKIRGLRNK